MTEMPELYRVFLSLSQTHTRIKHAAPCLRSLFSAFILLPSSCATFNLCSVYSCLMSCLAARIFIGFLDAWTFLDGRTDRLCCTMAEVNLESEESVWVVCMSSIQPSPKGFIIFLLGTLRTKDGIKILIDLDPGGHAWEFSNASVELGEDFVIQLHHFLHGLLCNCYGGFLQTCHWSVRENKGANTLGPNTIIINTTRVELAKLAEKHAQQTPIKLKEIKMFLEIA